MQPPASIITSSSSDGKPPHRSKFWLVKPVLEMNETTLKVASRAASGMAAPFHATRHRNRLATLTPVIHRNRRT